MALLLAACGRTLPSDPQTPSELRQVLAAELQPVALKNCEFERVGGANDGGYLMCGNLLTKPGAIYSYGIGGSDDWGCQLSKRFGLPVHEYDCFDLREPTCDGGRLVFHKECVGGKAATIESRLFDTIPNQLTKNGDSSKSLILKIDVEGAEWESFMATPDEVFARIDQLPMEIHGVDEPRILDVVRKLKRTFYLAHRHFNNNACDPGVAPFPASAQQALWVNKRIAARSGFFAAAPQLPNPLDAADNPSFPDCQKLVK